MTTDEHVQKFLDAEEQASQLVEELSNEYRSVSIQVRAGSERVRGRREDEPEWEETAI